METTNTQEQPLTGEEQKRGDILAKPFNDQYNDDDTEVSQSLRPYSKDENGIIFLVDDDFTGTTIDTVHERDLASFLAEKGITAA